MVQECNCKCVWVKNNVVNKWMWFCCIVVRCFGLPWPRGYPGITSRQSLCLRDPLGCSQVIIDLLILTKGRPCTTHMTSCVVSRAHMHHARRFLRSAPLGVSYRGISNLRVNLYRSQCLPRWSKPASDFLEGAPLQVIAAAAAQSTVLRPPMPW